MGDCHIGCTVRGVSGKSKIFHDKYRIQGEKDNSCSRLRKKACFKAKKPKKNKQARQDVCIVNQQDILHWIAGKIGGRCGAGFLMIGNWEVTRYREMSYEKYWTLFA